MSDCIFCKIIQGEIPTTKLYDDEDLVVIMDAYPSSVGHCLIIPKKHCDDIFDMDKIVATKIFPLASKMAKSIKKSLKCDGINILQNSGEAAGQTVSHFHVHIIPRYKNDNVTIKWDNKKIEQTLRLQTAKDIKMNF